MFVASQGKGPLLGLQTAPDMVSEFRGSPVCVLTCVYMCVCLCTCVRVHALCLSFCVCTPRRNLGLGAVLCALPVLLWQKPPTLCSQRPCPA